MNEVEMKIKEYQNKSRKGQYVYIKEKGKKASILKRRDNIPMGLYMLYYKDKTNKRRKLKAKSFIGYIKSYKGKSKDKSITKRKIKKGLSQYYRINKKAIHNEFKRGISKKVIPDILNLHHGILVKKTKELLEPLVLDKGLIRILVQESNLEKLKGRMTLKATIIGENGEKICEVNSIGILKPSEFINIIKKDFKKKTYVKYKDQDNMPNIAKKIGLNMVNWNKEGYIGRIELFMAITKDKQQSMIGVK